MHRRCLTFEAEVSPSNVRERRFTGEASTRQPPSHSDAGRPESGVPSTDPEPGRRRLCVMLRAMWRGRRDLRRLHDPRGWAEQTIGLLVMQTADNSLTTYTRRRRLGRGRVMTTRQGIGEPNPTHLPEANLVGRAVALRMDGIPGAGWYEALDIPVTAHFLGGCPIGLTREGGVVDPYHRVHGYDGLHVMDGSVVAANLGVNPSLTITAMAERAASLWPNKGEADPRPRDGYRRIGAVAPAAPVVPPTAPAALRLPLYVVDGTD